MFVFLSKNTSKKGLALRLLPSLFNARLSEQGVVLRLQSKVRTMHAQIDFFDYADA